MLRGAGRENAFILIKNSIAPNNFYHLLAGRFVAADNNKSRATGCFFSANHKYSKGYIANFPVFQMLVMGIEKPPHVGLQSSQLLPTRILNFPEVLLSNFAAMLSDRLLSIGPLRNKSGRFVRLQP
jgi:hypothetical protein